MDTPILVFATHNQHKAREIQQLVGSSYTIKTLVDIGCTEEIPETGETLAQNAFIKSNYVFVNYGLPCFADDTGLEVEVLNGQPGVYSARYAGLQKNDTDNMNLLLLNLKHSENRNACFKTVISFNDGVQSVFFEGILEGSIAQNAIGENGFGYDPIFIPTSLNITLAQMEPSDKNAISHRAKATKKLIDFLAH